MYLEYCILISYFCFHETTKQFFGRSAQVILVTHVDTCSTKHLHSFRVRQNEAATTLRKGHCL